MRVDRDDRLHNLHTRPVLLSIDYQGKRLDLGMKQASEDWQGSTQPRQRRRESVPQPPATGGFGTLGDLLKGLDLKK